MPAHYDIFLSYAHVDAEIALNLHGKLRAAGLSCFMAEQDISAATEWEPAIRNALCDADNVLLLITPRSKDSKWVIAEAGAAWALNKTVVPALMFVNPTELIVPISKFQSCRVETPSQIEQLVATLAARRPASATDDIDVFLAAPMAAHDSDAEYQATRNEVMKVHDAFIQECNFKVYCALAHCPTMKSFEALDVSVIKDLRAIKDAKYFVLLYPQKITSSVLFEAGFALALRKFSLYFVARRQDLPYMMQDAASIFRDVRLHELPAFAVSADCIVDDIRTNKEQLFMLRNSI